MSIEESASAPPSASAPATGLAQIRDRADYLIALLDLKGRGLLLIAGLLAVAWVASGVYKVQPDEQGVVLRFGRWLDTTEPGLHYHLPYPIETVLLPKVTQVNQLQLGGGSSGGHRRQFARQADADR